MELEVQQWMALLASLLVGVRQATVWRDFVHSRVTEGRTMTRKEMES